jgi:hypothetical protein
VSSNRCPDWKLLGSYADELFHILYRLDSGMMREDGFEYGEAGVRQFAEAYRSGEDHHYQPLRTHAPTRE